MLPPCITFYWFRVGPYLSIHVEMDQGSSLDFGQVFLAQGSLGPFTLISQKSSGLSLLDSLFLELSVLFAILRSPKQSILKIR